jgi:hypothetical protein
MSKLWYNRASSKGLKGKIQVMVLAALIVVKQNILREIVSN